jgi:hypothetical protein
VVEQELKILVFHILVHLVVQVEEEQVMVDLLVMQEEQVTHLQLVLLKVKMVDLTVVVEVEQQVT